MKDQLITCMKYDTLSDTSDLTWEDMLTILELFQTRINETIELVRRKVADEDLNTCITMMDENEYTARNIRATKTD